MLIRETLWFYYYHLLLLLLSLLLVSLPSLLLSSHCYWLYHCYYSYQSCCWRHNTKWYWQLWYKQNINNLVAVMMMLLLLPSLSWPDASLGLCQPRADSTEITAVPFGRSCVGRRRRGTQTFADLLISSADTSSMTDNVASKTFRKKEVWWHWSC